MRCIVSLFGVVASIVLIAAATALTQAAPYGPTAAITCPAGAIPVLPGQDLSLTVSQAPTGATICVQAGTHQPTRPIYMRAGQFLVGEYGAVIDGTQVMQPFDQGGIAVVSGWNCADCANVTVQNLVIRGRDDIHCVGAYGAQAGGWIVEHNEITGCRWGVTFGRSWNGTATTKVYVQGPTIRANNIHHNIWSGATGADGSGAYGFQNTDGALLLNNEIAYSGGQPKFTGSINSVAAGNFVHHNPEGIWFDGDNLNALIENNRIEDHAGEGIFYEISGPGVVRRNTVLRSGASGIFISTSRDVEVYENRLEENARGVNLFVSCEMVGGPDYPYPTAIGFDLRNVNVHDNVTVVGEPRTQPDVIAGSLSFAGCTSDQFAMYRDGAKNLRWNRNTYTVRDVTLPLWYWDGWKRWDEWQAIGHDLDGTVTTGSPPPPTTCALNGVTYQQGDQTTVVLKTTLISLWLSDHPEWRLISSARKNRVQSYVTVECQ